MQRLLHVCAHLMPPVTSAVTGLDKGVGVL